VKKINYQYALGEILIVIIGISIAFSMNKCADNSKDATLRQQYLINIKNDVSIDKTILKENVGILQDKIETTVDILKILTQDSINNLRATRGLFSLPKLVNFTPKTISYQTLINSGDLKLIDNFKLKTHIEEHYNNYNVMLKSYERMENIQKTYFGPYFINDIDYEAFSRNEFGFKEISKLKNIVRSSQGALYLKIEATNNGIRSCDSLLITLEKALKN